MALSVIGAGFGRTGTFSLNAALETLGFGPCHHMADVNASPVQKEMFRAAGRGQPVDWDEVYAGFRSAVDWPTAHFWRELAAHYPDAKIVLTVRVADDWYTSMSNTVLRHMGPDADPATFGVAVVAKQVFGGRTGDAEHCKQVFEAHNAEVIREIPPDRLLVYRVSEGWPSLCAFLGTPVPQQPFPATNSTEAFRSGVGFRL